ncbi:MAG: Mpv17/PMP22 family protein [Bacteroidota bacterium]|nr:Mpv17/PMP22 family protein [Bacteroidota bacterium]
MKKKDLVFIFAVIVFFSPFFLCDYVFDAYQSFNAAHGMIMSFIKFAVLATLGESIGLRIKEGVYNKKGFGLFPRVIVWGFIGVTIKLAFVIFGAGTPAFLEYVGIKGAGASMDGELTFTRVITAFSISVAINMIFAPIFMTFHKITDNHIINNGGTIKGFFTPIKFGEIIKNLDWGVQWNFVFKKTIPFFWIPAHTITFLMPAEYRVLFAAVLGIVLGVLLAVASSMGRK